MRLKPRSPHLRESRAVHPRRLQRTAALDPGYSAVEALRQTRRMWKPAYPCRHPAQLGLQLGLRKVWSSRPWTLRKQREAKRDSVLLGQLPSGSEVDRLRPKPFGPAGQVWETLHMGRWRQRPTWHQLPFKRMPASHCHQRPAALKLQVDARRSSLRIHPDFRPFQERVCLLMWCG